MFQNPSDVSILTDIEGRSPACREEQRPAKDGNTAWKAARVFPFSPLLSLPYELRQRVFQYVFTDSSSEISPSQKTRSPKRLLGMVGDRYKISGARSSNKAVYKDFVQSLLLCRQLYRETRLMALQVNRVKCPATMGSNTSATKQFLDALMPIQRRAIRRLELHLLASVTEAWSLRSILRSIAGVREEGGGGGLGKSSGGRSSLRELTVRIATRDLLLAQADSTVGLLHILSVAPFPQDRPSTALVCAATWVTEGLAFLQSLRRLTIVIECSVSVATLVTATERSHFEQTLRSSLSSANVTVEWRVHTGMIVDDNE